MQASPEALPQTAGPATRQALKGGGFERQAPERQERCTPQKAIHPEG